MESLRRAKDVRPRRARWMLHTVALSGTLMSSNLICFAQSTTTNNKPPAADARQAASTTGADRTPLADRERSELLQIIRDLQKRVERLESQASNGAATSTQIQGDAAVSGASNAVKPPTAPAQAPRATVAGTSQTLDAGTPVPAMVTSKETGPPPSEVADSQASGQAEGRQGLGSYTPNLGFKIADTEYGDLNLSIYTYVRYLNQLGLDSNYQDDFGNTKNVQRRQDVQIQKLQIKFLGWLLSKKLRYFLYAWTSNANQGSGAQVVLAGNLQYTINKHLTLGGGIRSLPGTRSVEGNFPFWLGVDSRMIADEYMRPSYTSGFWAVGDITDRLKYQVMLGNNMSTLGVPAVRLDNGLNTVSSALIWFPSGEFEVGFSGQGWGDFEHHDKLATRLAVHLNRSDENKESQPNSDAFENTQLRLSDGTVVFTPDLFGPGITIDDATWKMASVDGGLKYRGYALEGEYYFRKLTNFRGTNTAGLEDVFDHGFQLQGSAMVLPKTLQAYVGHSRIFGKFGDPWDLRFGLNWFPFKNHVVRWNTEGLYLYNSPVGYTSVPFALGGRGMVFHSTLEFAF